jgi:hypothetical protein
MENPNIETNFSYDLIEYIINTISNDIIEGFLSNELDDNGDRIYVYGLRELLTLIKLEEIDVESSDDILFTFLKMSYPNNLKSCRVLMERWINSNINEEKMPIFTAMIINNKYDIDILRFIKNSFEIPYNEINKNATEEMIKAENRNNISHYEHILNMIEYDSDPIMMNACAILEEIYDILTLDTYKELFKLAVARENNVIAEFMSKKIEELSPEIRKPTYVKNYGVYLNADIPKNKNIQLPEDDEEDIYNLPDEEQAFKLMMIGAESYDLNVIDADEHPEILKGELNEKTMSKKQKQVKEKFIIWWRTADISEKHRLIDPILHKNNELDKYENITDDLMNQDAINVFRILGPSLVIPNAMLSKDSDYICEHYGGCRMFTCNCLIEYGDDQDLPDQDSDWFTGNCIQCKNKIENRIYAVRMPKIGGAWEGCYCSFICLKQSAKEDGQITVVGKMIDIIEEKINKYGIQDRIFESLDELINTGSYNQ